MLVVFPRDVGCTLGIFMASRHLQRVAHEESSCRPAALSIELFIDAPAHRFGKRDAPLLRPALEAAVLIGCQLDLCTHHDVIVMM